MTVIYRETARPYRISLSDKHQSPYCKAQKRQSVDSRTKCNREEERGEKFERGDVVMFLPGSIVE